jgi:hypothetical protein
MSDRPLSSLAVKPIIHYPREVQVGKTYLMTIDLEIEEGFEWQSEEEYPIYCKVESDLFNIKAIGEPVIVLHRFGGSYGEAKFLLRTIHRIADGEIKIALINKWGLIFKIFNITDVRLSDIQEETEAIVNDDEENFSSRRKERNKNQLQCHNWQQEHEIPYFDENDSWNTFHDGEPPLDCYLHYSYAETYNFKVDNPSETKVDYSDRKPEEFLPKVSKVNQEVIDWLWDNFPGWDE